MGANIRQLQEKVKQFCEARDWDQYHNAKDLAIGVITEAGELLDHFRFKSEKEIEEMLSNPSKKEVISEEMADVLYFVLRLAQKYEIDLETSFVKKMIKNEEKYPTHKSKGSNKKASEL